MPRHPRRPRPASLVLAVATAILLLGASACGGTDEVTPEQFQAELLERTNPEEGDPIVPESVAACLTDKIFDEFDQEEVDRIYRAATQTELDEDVRATLNRFNGECFEAEAAAAGEGEGEGEGSTTTTAAEGEGEADGSTTTGGDATTTTAASEDATTTSEG